MNEKLEQLFEHYNDERQYLGDGYYRLKTMAPNKYELEFSKSGYCGTFESAPAIGFTLSENGQVTLGSYRDVVATPLKMTSFSEEPEFVSQAFETLVEKFINQIP
jgi:hypothetical protein